MMVRGGGGDDDDNDGSDDDAKDGPGEYTAGVTSGAGAGATSARKMCFLSFPVFSGALTVSVYSTDVHLKRKQKTKTKN